MCIRDSTHTTVQSNNILGLLTPDIYNKIHNIINSLNVPKGDVRAHKSNNEKTTR